jgi:hypothetical protein
MNLTQIEFDSATTAYRDFDSNEALMLMVPLRLLYFLEK